MNAWPRADPVKARGYLRLGDRRHRPAGAIILAILTATLVAWTVLPVQPHDLGVFLRAGSQVAAGHDPYTHPGNPALWSGSAFVYPWVIAWPFAALGLLPQPVAVALFRLAGIAAVAIGCRLAGGRHFLAITALIGSSVFLLGLQEGTLDALLFGGLVLAWRNRDRPYALAAVLAVLITSELFLWPLVIWAWFSKRKLAAVGATIATGALMAVGSASGEPLTSYVRSLSQLSRHEGPHSSSLFALALQVGAPAAGASLLAVAVALCIVALSIRAERRSGYPVGFAGAVAASLIAIPILWSHYLLLLGVPILIADVETDTKVALLGLFDVASWARYTPYQSTWQLTLLGTAIALVALAAAVWPIPSWRVLVSRLRAALATLPAPTYVLLGLLCVLGCLADERGLRITAVQCAIVAVCGYAISAGGQRVEVAVPSES